MKLKCLGTGSNGNCYILKASNGSVLILDAGVSVSKIERAIGWNLKRVSGVLVTHEHKDHSKSLEALRDIGLPIYAPYISKFPKGMGRDFVVRPFDLTTLDGHWTHTNADGTECPCYGFIISHPEMGNLIYVTDTSMVKYKFKTIGVNHILIGVNYDETLMEDESSTKLSHVYRGHMSLKTACEFVKANRKTKDLQNVIMCHLSERNADKEVFLKRMRRASYKANVDVAEAGKEWELKIDRCPF